jgi:hypothetical protein
MNNYAIFSRKGEWLGEIRGVDSAAEAKREWVDSFGRTLGYGLRQIKAERLPADEMAGLESAAHTCGPFGNA